MGKKVERNKKWQSEWEKDESLIVNERFKLEVPHLKLD